MARFPCGGSDSLLLVLIVLAIAGGLPRVALSSAAARCEGAQLALGQCSVLAGLGEDVTAEAFSGASGNGTDGVCALGGHAPLESVEVLGSVRMVVLRFGTDLDRCCEAKLALDNCSSIEHAEYDQEASSASHRATLRTVVAAFAVVAALAAAPAVAPLP